MNYYHKNDKDKNKIENKKFYLSKKHTY